VFCPPLGREASNALPAVQVACAQAAAAGLVALRFDYDGTGDSAGRLSDPDRVSAWLDSVHRAVGLARTLCPGPVILVGVRTGALLATASCERGTTVDGLVLWDPSLSGRRFLRLEQTLLATGFAAPQPDDGSVAGPAFSYSAQTVHDLSPVVLHPLGPSGPPTCVFGRAGDRTTDSIRREFEEAGVDWVDAEGQSELFDRYPDDLVVPRTMIKALVERMGQLVVGPEEPVQFVPQDDAVVLDDGSPVHEHPLWLGPNRIFAMSSEPAAGTELTGSPTLVFLSAGALDHTGPGRQWVELTRRFATEGLRALRVDLDGLGETEGRPDLPRNVPKLATAIDDVCDLCTALGDPEARDIVFVGLSSGGYHAIEVALRLHPRAICVMNPGTTAPVAELDSGEPIDPRRLAYRPRPAVLRRMAVKHQRMARILTLALLQVAVWRSPHRPIAGVSRRRIPFLLILTEEDSGHFEPSPYWWLVRRRRQRTGLFNERIVPGFDHSLYTIQGQECTYPILISWITDRYGRRSPQADSASLK
jgi:alpha-beta hydrolase superfamily lysophospholipase